MDVDQDKSGDIAPEKPLTSASHTIQRSSSRDFRGQVFAHRGQFRGQVRASVSTRAVAKVYYVSLVGGGVVERVMEPDRIS